MEKNITEEFEENVPYIVKLKKYTFLTNYFNYFTGYLVNNANGNFYFELTDSRMLVIVPHNQICKMYPDSNIYIKYCDEKQEEDKPNSQDDDDGFVFKETREDS